jgi:glycerol-3-phosphate dehydrogenase
VPATYDLAIIGGGISGCGIARDVAGRVQFCTDFVGGTSRERRLADAELS